MTDAGKKGRILAIVLVQLLLLTGLVARLLHLHVGSAQNDRKEIDDTRFYRKQVSVVRGRIYDTREDENVLAMDLPLKNLIADPDFMLEHEDVAVVAEQLAPLLDESVASLMAKLDQPGKRCEILARLMNDEDASRISALKVKGLYFTDVTCRKYPQASLMCHVIGFSNSEGVGSAGVEQTMNRFLKGCSGYLEGRLDGRRRELYDRRIQDIKPSDGSDVHLTVDQNIQYFAEKALDKSLENVGSTRGAVIVQNIKTGEILAMVSRPAFDLNQFGKSKEDERLNRAVGLNYEPGSTLKCVSIAAVLEENLATPKKKVFCEDGMWMHYRKPLRDHHGYGSLTVEDILKKSSNIGTAKLAIRLGDERFHSYLVKFGFGSKLGIDMPGEETGILAPASRWSGISASRLAIGQGISVTPLQMVSAVSAIANDGMLMRPYIIKEVISNSGRTQYRGRPKELRRALSVKTAKTMQAMMARVSEDGGTGVRARVPGYTVAGKTGTAQKVIDGRYSETLFVASFVGFLPAERPEIAIIAVVDEPVRPKHYGSTAASPIFAEVGAHVVRYLDITPSIDESATL